MQAHGSAGTLAPSRNGVLFVSGYATSLRVERGHLIVRTGSGHSIREGRISKVSRPRLRRLVVHGIGGGALSVRALAWLDGVGASLVVLSWDGEPVVASSRPGSDDPALRRAQARAVDSEVGLEISRHLIGEKLAGQLSVLERRLAASGGEAGQVRGCIEALERASSLTEVRLVESRAAVAYWSVWSEVAVRFGTPSLRTIPEHWLRMGSRTSPLSAGPRNATTPANALANYLYAIGESEARIALHAVGLDPGLGILHADQRSRDSLALDLVEVIRPRIDEYLLDQLARRTFSRSDFGEFPNGTCRVGAPLCKVLAETGPTWAAALAPHAEQVARMLAGRRPANRRLATPLTQDNRSASRDGIHREAARPRRPRPARLPYACRSCGLVFDEASRDRDLCDECLLEVRRANVAGFQAAGRAAVERSIADGRHVSTNPEAKAKLGRANARRVAEATAWNRAHPEPADPAVFRSEILPGLAGMPLSEIAAATGLSIPYCSQLRRGLVVPHPRHWDVLRELPSP